MKRTRKPQPRPQTAEAKADRLFVEMMQVLRGCRNVELLIVPIQGQLPLVAHINDPLSQAKSA